MNVQLTNTKVCKKCGWIVSNEYATAYCPACKTPYTEGFCRLCGQYSYDIAPGRMQCKKCASKRNHEISHSSRDMLVYNVDIIFGQWTDKISKLPFIPLTDEQWIQTCNFFKGCAVCGKDEIVARSFFIPFKDGGKYTAWNIIPLCEHCATRQKVTANPFKRLRPEFCQHNNIKYLQKITEYLQSQMPKE